MSAGPILVAGGSGMAGLGVLGAIEKGLPSASVRATYNSTAPAGIFPGTEWVKADLTTREGCKKAVWGCGSAILVAANTGGASAAMANPAHQVTDNIVMDALLLESLHEAGVSRVVYVSSATVYQETEGRIKEGDLDWNKDPHPAYLGVGWAKRSAEKLCWFWHSKYGMEIVVARASNIYGPFAKFNPATSNFIPAIVRKAVDGMDPFEVWGSPDVSRDVIFSEDFGSAVLALYNAGGVKYNVFNLGTGMPVTVNQVVLAALGAAEHKPSKIVYSGPVGAVVRQRVLDCSKLFDATGWTPKFSLRDGIAATVEWWRENGRVWKK
ncbi:MAG: NAD(P)-dependent oxidoreductase [Nitrospinae bacterium]|nr:NAD(P)-dependent oxidoreductase [Nitrospinota bacterium]